MTASIEYPPGTPSWVDVSSPEPDAAAAFYGELFGWRAEAAGPPEETGDYRIFSLEGRQVAGLGALPAGGVPAWTTYVSVADAEAALAKVEAAGGRTRMGPVEVPGAGVMAVFEDGADGAVFSVWQPGGNRGAQAVNGAGLLTWNELDTRDVDGAQRFYGEVFGWRGEPIEAEGDVVYVTWKLDGRTVGGMLPMGDAFPPEVPANWLAYFGVEDIEAAAATAERLGGRVLMPRQAMPQGAFAVLADPHGAAFGIWQGSYDPPPGA